MCFSFIYENHDEAEFLYLLSPLSRVICYIINDYLCALLQLLFVYSFNLPNIPKTWSKGTLSDIADITMGQSPSGDSYNILGEGCPFYQGSTDFGVIFPSIRMYTSAPSRYASTLDTLLSVRAPVGSMNIAFENCCIGRGLASIHGKYNNNTFVRYLLKNSKWYFENINNSGTTFGSITKDYLFKMPVIIPDSRSVELFEEQSNFIEQEIYKNEQQSRELQYLRDWLLPMLMNGQATIED
jgi:type I restriction enzyme S subunit